MYWSNSLTNTFLKRILNIFEVFKLFYVCGIASLYDNSWTMFFVFYFFYRIHFYRFFWSMVRKSEHPQISCQKQVYLFLIDQAIIFQDCFSRGSRRKGVLSFYSKTAQKRPHEKCFHFIFLGYIKIEVRKYSENILNTQVCSYKRETFRVGKKVSNIYDTFTQ